MEGETKTVTTIAKKLHVRPGRLLAELRTDETVVQATCTDDEKAAAFELLRDPDLKSRFLAACHTRYLGRDKTLLLVKFACLTRHLGRALSVILSGASSTGKSYLLETVLLTCLRETYEHFTRTSAQYLLYRQDPVDHKIITYYELQGIGQTAEIIRTALSEGVMRLGTVVKDDSGSLGALNIEKDTEGLVILSTHTGRDLDHELATRVLTQELTHNEKLAREIYRRKAEEQNRPTDEDTYRIWQVADSLIEPLNVHIPYLPRLAELFPTREERYLRDYDKVVALVKASALWHQYQRERQDDGSIIATRRDYELVYGLGEVFMESALPVSPPVLSLVEMLAANPAMTRAEVLGTCSSSDRSLRRHIDQAVQAGLLEKIGRGVKQTFKVIEIPEPQTVLPSPDEVFSRPSDVQMSNETITVSADGEILDTTVCPEVSGCPGGGMSQAGPVRNRTTGQNPDNGGVR